VTGRTAHNVLPSFVESLAPLEPALVETDAHGLASTALRTAARRSLIVLLTSLDPSAVEDGLLPVLPLLTKRHTVLIAAVTDPRLHEMERARGTIDAVYESAAAAQAHTERAQTADRLRRYGAIVIDALPSDIAPTLADTYLALKAAGRL